MVRLSQSVFQLPVIALSLSERVSPPGRSAAPPVFWTCVTVVSVSDGRDSSVTEEALIPELSFPFDPDGAARTPTKSRRAAAMKTALIEGFEKAFMSISLKRL
jgi:hypothetical protein